MDTNHRIMKQLMASNPSEEDIAELYNDLRSIFEGPFDEMINEAIVLRQCVYVEQESNAVMH